jgi:hypothetical protein
VPILGTVLVGITLLLVFWIIMQMKSDEVDSVVGVVIVGTLLVSPYLWTYSQILLVIPMMMMVAVIYKRNWPFLAIATFPLLMALFAVLLILISMRIGADILSVMVPIVVGALLVLAYHIGFNPAKDFTG